MIAKIPLKRKDGRSSFKQLTNYCLGKSAGQDERVLHIGMQGVQSADTAHVEMESVSILNLKCKNPVYHFILSWREGEKPTYNQVDEAVGIALKELDLQKCQALWGLHENKENLHVHVAVNRVSEEDNFKAIAPAGGWDKRALERASRKIEIAQGWQIEETGYYTVENGEVLEKARNTGRVKLSQASRDIEAHTGEQSAERIGKLASPIIAEAVGWEELHRRLAEIGIRYEKKGSGALIWVGKTAVKASKIHKDFSLSKLSARLGDYQARSEEVIVQPLTAQPVEKISGQPKVNAAWENYQKAKKEYRSRKDTAFTELKQRHKEERDILKRGQKEARDKLQDEKDWRGKGIELNMRRNLLAGEQEIEKLNLRDSQREETEKLKAMFPWKFPNFKAWLNQGHDVEPLQLYRYEQSLVLSGDGTFSARNADLRDFTGTPGNKNSVFYFRKGTTGKADFIDYGKKIVISSAPTDDVILAAFQLASAKWGAVEINGTDEYKQTCVKLAIEHGFRIKNPDLQEIVAKEKARQRQKLLKLPEIGQMVIVHAEGNKKYQITGTVDSIYEKNGRDVVVIKRGEKTLPFYADRVRFENVKEQARPLPSKQAKQHNKNSGLER